MPRHTAACRLCGTLVMCHVACFGWNELCISHLGAELCCSEEAHSEPRLRCRYPHLCNGGAYRYVCIQFQLFFSCPDWVKSDRIEGRALMQQTGYGILRFCESGPLAMHIR
ncbi:hypothetical protein LZ32DRAFT_117855 [Colletotrichum eremochloae]|nr:hypothetical protein LZ32DRAFT_117855 [Colletotrichum eremochloae]